MKGRVVMALLLTMGLLFAGASDSKPAKKEKEPPRKYLAERIKGCGQDFAVVRLYADEFELLSLPEKIEVYYLTEAALAGRDIWFDQNHRQALRVRSLLEEIVTHPGGIEPAILKKIAAYLKLFWINGGNYGERSKTKFVPDFTFEELAEAALRAKRNGASFGVIDARAVRSLLGELRRTIFDKDYEPLSVCKDSTKDIVAGSAGNFYAPGVTAADLEGFKDEYPLNSRIVKKNGKIVEEVCRVGGRYSKELTVIVENLRRAEDAIPATKEGREEKKVLELLARFFRTGKASDFEAYNIQWVKTHSRVDAILGFIESYKDPRGVKASFEGIVHYVDYKGTRLMNHLGRNVRYFEEHMPWEKKYCRTNFDNVPSANAVNMALGSADGGSMAPIGVNLPNDEKLRETHGTKSVTLGNALKSYKKVSGQKVKKEFYEGDDVALMLAFGDRSDELHTALHEVIGHGSGRVHVEDPDGHLKEYARTLEEARAELVGLYYGSDPVLAADNLFTKEEVVKLGEACLKSYAVADFTMLRRIEGDEIQDDHMRALHLINTWLREKTGAVKAVTIGGKTFIKVTDLGKMKKGVAELLSTIMEIKANGDYDKARDLVTRYAIKIDTAWRDEAKERFRTLNIPPYSALLMPRFIPVRGRDGAIRDIRVANDESLLEQELRLSGYDARAIGRAVKAMSGGK